MGLPQTLMAAPVASHLPSHPYKRSAGNAYSPNSFPDCRTAQVLVGRQGIEPGSKLRLDRFQFSPQFLTAGRRSNGHYQFGQSVESMNDDSPSIRRGFGEENELAGNQCPPGAGNSVEGEERQGSLCLTRHHRLPGGIPDPGLRRVRNPLRRRSVAGPPNGE